MEKVLGTILLILVPNTVKCNLQYNLVKIVSCSASYNQNGYHCSTSIDGIYQNTGGGWAIDSKIPQQVTYTLEYPVYLDKVRIVSGVNRNDHHVTGVNLQYTADDGTVTTILDATVNEDVGATQNSETGDIILSKTLKDYTIVFPLTAKTKKLTLKALQSDLGVRNNFVLTEVIVSGESSG